MGRKRKSRTAEPTQATPTVKSEPQDQPEMDPEQIVQDEQTQPVQNEEEEPIEDEQLVEEEEEEEEEEEPDAIKSEAVDDTENNEPVVIMTEKPPESVGELLNGTEQVKMEKEEEDLEEEPLEKLLEPFTKDQMTLLIKEAIVKHPDIVENVHKLADADPAHRKIFVHGLGWEAVSETIVSVFGKYGEIEDCKVVRDKLTNKSKGYGFILFKHRDGARRALKQPQKLIEGRMTSCQLASAGPVQAPPPTTVVAASAPVSEYTQRKIYVSNVSAELDPRKLLEYFGQFGEIEEGPLGLDKQTGKPRGFCLFVYKSLEGAKKALEEPHKTYEGQTLHCQKAVDGPKHSKGGHFQQHGQQQHHHHHQQSGYHHHQAKKGRYSGGGSGHAGGHLMAPSVPPSMGFNPAVAPAAIGQAVAALLASHGGLGIGNLLGGTGAGPNQQGVPPMMNNAGYAGQSGYPGQPGVQGGYAAQPHMGQGGVRPHQGGPPYMGHGR